MKHPDITTWADYARALVTTDERAAMKGHLDDGCATCRGILAAFERVAATAERESALEPPAGMVRSVKAFFAVQHPERRGTWNELELTSAFDSALAPAPAALRAQGDGHRQLLFESDDYTVELSVDRSPGAEDAVLRGQILEAHGGPRSHTPVFLIGAGEVIDRAISERQGTFEMSGRLDQPCELWVFPDDENRIRLALTPDS